MHYAGLGKLGRPHGVSPAEFCHFAHVARLARYVDGAAAASQKADRSRLAATFDAARARRLEAARGPRRKRDERKGDDDDDDDDDDDRAAAAPRASVSVASIPRLMSRAEFVGALVHLALHAAPGAPTLLDEVKERLERDAEDEATSPRSQNDERSSPRGPARARKNPAPRNSAPESPMGALEHLVARHVQPFLELRKVGPASDAGHLLERFDGPAVQDAIHVNRAHLRRVFDHYARLPRPTRDGDENDDLNGDDVHATDPGLTQSHFKTVLDRAGLPTARRSGLGRSRRSPSTLKRNAPWLPHRSSRRRTSPNSCSPRPARTKN